MSPSQAQGGSLVGVLPIPNGTTPEQLGYTEAYAAAKAKQAEGFRTTLTQGGLSPLTSGYLTGYAQYHQKQNYYCLEGVLQSILKFKFGTTWIQPSITSKQNTIYSSVGTNESNALSYINSQLAGYGVSFRYVSVHAPGLITFESYMYTDITANVYPTYVGVDVTNSDDVWHQTNPANHATGAVGYGSSGATVRIADPLTSPNTGPAYCNIGAVNPTYSSTPDNGCIYAAYDSQKYLNASYGQWY